MVLPQNHNKEIKIDSKKSPTERTDKDRHCYEAPVKREEISKEDNSSGKLGFQIHLYNFQCIG